MTAPRKGPGRPKVPANLALVRRNYRFPPQAVDLIKRAAEQLKVTETEFVLGAATDAAKRVLGANT